MMTSAQARQTFLDFFKSKGHEIVPSAPMIVKNDPTLMFINSGMAPFKDIFLGNAPIKFPRVADTQKCLRVSGKHNDLEEVGVDTYHHTMFEMLGNWSFGDYFKKEAITWAWELLTEVYKLDKNRLYVTVFEGYEKENLAFDQEAYDTWKQFIAEDRILNGNKKDNFWEMGDTGPCGPCSEIHIDLRDDAERALVDGKTLVNNDHPQVIEIWNNVFMEFERKADGSLVKLPSQHVDTGMGFERLCVALQGKKSNYDTDVFQPLIKKIEEIAKLQYGFTSSNDTGDAQQIKADIAMRVVADHIRTVAFSIADGQLPSNNKAGYVIRRILRRAIRYGYSSLNIQQPFMYQLVDTLCAEMGKFFPEIQAQKTLIEKVIKEEEEAFLRTLGTGLNLLNSQFKNSNDANAVLSGEIAFTLSDTFGFPIDLTQLICRENNYSVDMETFNKCLEEQKNRSRAAAAVETDDWVNVSNDASFQFVGYEKTESTAKILRYRKVAAKGKTQFQLVLNETPFYAESGGQVGDTGTLQSINETIHIIDTKKENGVWMHIAETLPEKLEVAFDAKIDVARRIEIQNNHTATHLMHAALRKVLGTHVEQKGSLVNDQYLRFDFSHFAKVSNEEITAIENMVNEKIRENIILNVQQLAIDEARKLGAMALFGEKYGDVVRVVTFDKNYSVELCGGTHAPATGNIGLFKIISEGAVAAGVRRIEAISSKAAMDYFNTQLQTLQTVNEALKNPKNTVKGVEDLLSKNADLEKRIAAFEKQQVTALKNELKSKFVSENGMNILKGKIEIGSNENLKDLCFQLKAEVENAAIYLGAEINGKATIAVAFSDSLIKDNNKHAGNVIKAIAKEINGGGGGQAAFATAGGTNVDGIEKALEMGVGFAN
jgi:alanyl-tRNA synthetase